MSKPDQKLKTKLGSRYKLNKQLKTEWPQRPGWLTCDSWSPSHLQCGLQLLTKMGCFGMLCANSDMWKSVKIQKAMISKVIWCILMGTCTGSLYLTDLFTQKHWCLDGSVWFPGMSTWWQISLSDWEDNQTCYNQLKYRRLMLSKVTWFILNM